MNNNLEKHNIGEQEVYCTRCDEWADIHHFSQTHDTTIVKAIDRIETSLIDSLRDLRVVREYLTEDHHENKSNV